MDHQSTKARFLGAYDAYATEVFRFCLLKVSNRERAEDLTQETFMRFWQVLRKGENIKNERAYLYRLARNLVIDWYRRKKESSLDVLTESGFDFAGSDAGDVMVEAESSEVLRMLNELDDESKEILLLRYVEGYAPKEISKILKVSANVVSVRIHRAVKKLQEKMHTK